MDDKKPDMENRGHCPISGSKIHRFFECPTSFWPTPGDLPDTQSRAAVEGERAHGYAEKAVWGGEEAIADCRNQLMRWGAMTYSSFIHTWSPDIKGLSTEVFVRMGGSFGLPLSEIGGYYDAFYEDESSIHAFDYKFGMHVVEPDTPQLTFYILAKALDSMWDNGLLPVWRDEIKTAVYDWIGVRSIRQSIIQPKRTDGAIHTCVLSMEEIGDFIDKMCDSVEIYSDVGRFDQSLTRENEYCRYCNKRNICSRAITTQQEERNPCQLTFRKK